MRGSGSWQTLTSSFAITIPAAAQAGDRMYLLAAWKPFGVTADVTGWTEVTEFADGSVANGNGVGSVKVACYYKDHSGSESNPTLTFTGTVDIACAVIVVFSKGAGETWNTPSFVTASMTTWTTSTQTTAASSTVTVPSGGVVIGLAGIRDDSTTITRPTTGIDDSGGLVTWNGNYAEHPVSHVSTTTNNDMSADAGYRLVTTGASGVTLRQTCTALSAAETGALLWIVQGVSASGTTFTPSAFDAALTFSGGISRQTGKSLSGSLTPSGSIVKSTARTLAGSITPAGSLVKQTARSLAGGLSFVGSMTRSKVALVTFNAALTFSGAISKRANKALAGSITPSGVLVRASRKSFAASLGFAGSLSKRTSRSLAGSITPAGSLVKRSNKTLAGALTFSGSLSRQVRKTLSAALTFSGNLARLYIPAIVGQEYQIAFNATLSFSGQLLAGSLRIAHDALERWGPRVRWPFRNGLRPRR